MFNTRAQLFYCSFNVLWGAKKHLIEYFYWLQSHVTRANMELGLFCLLKQPNKLFCLVMTDTDSIYCLFAGTSVLESVPPANREAFLAEADKWMILDESTNSSNPLAIGKFKVSPLSQALQRIFQFTPLQMEASCHEFIAPSAKCYFLADAKGNRTKLASKGVRQSLHNEKVP